MNEPPNSRYLDARLDDHQRQLDTVRTALEGLTPIAGSVGRLGVQLDYLTDDVGEIKKHCEDTRRLMHKRAERDDKQGFSRRSAVLVALIGGFFVLLNIAASVTVALVT